MYIRFQPLEKNIRSLFLAGFLLLLTVVGSFAQTGVTRIYTDYNGYWTSSSTVINSTKPDNSHNLLGFTWNGVTYSTGVNNALLTSKGVSFSATTYQAFPVKNITLPGTSSNFVGFGQLYDGIDNGGSTPPPFTVPADISRLLTDGVNGLDLGICVTNIPTSSSALTFTFSSITNNAALIGDGTPDILISQVAQPDNTYDQVYFEDKNGALVGTIVSINESTTAVPSVGNWTADFYNPNTGVIAPGFIKTDRPIRIWAADASLFGLTAGNYKNAVVLRYKLGGTSDPAFLAFNTAFIQLVSANDDVAVTDVGVPVSVSVTANDQPTGGLAPSSLTVTSAPTHGTVTINTTTGVATYSPSANFSGTDTFKYQVCNAAGQCDDALVTITVGSADLAVVTTVSSTTPSKGNNVSFVVKATSNGPNEATGVVVRDVLPSGYAFVSASTNQYSSNTGNWTIGSLTNTATASLTITAAVNETGIYSNTATISGTKQDFTDNNNASTVTATPVSVSDRSVTKVASSTAPAVGSIVSFTVTATNIGPSTTTGVRVNDLLTSGYSFQSATPSMGTYSSTTGLWTVGTMAKNGTATLVISATVNSTGTYSNTATISGTETDPVTSNNTVAITPVPVLQTDLGITQHVDKLTPDVGANVIFTLVATNNGPSPASGVSVRESLPSGYSLVSASATAGSYGAGSGQWTIGNLSSGQSTTLTITATVSATGSYTSLATISGAETDPDNTNNTAGVAPVPVPKADLAVVNTVSKTTPDVGANVIFNLVASNNGPSGATGVTVNESLPSGYSLISASATAGSYSGGVWSVGSLSVGQSATLTITATVSASGSYTSTASISGQQADPVSSNNSSTVFTVPVAQTDLAITQSVDSLTPTVGQTVVISLVATNNGPSPATSVIVSESLPSGYSLVSASGGSGSYNAESGQWSVGSLSSGQSVTLNITARVNASGSYTSTASISGAEADPVASNNSSTLSTTPVAQADLVITKTLDNALLNDDKGIFTITVVNRGPSAGTNVVVNDILPNGYTYVSSSATLGSYSATTGTWQINTLPVNAPATLTLNTSLNASGDFVNTVTVSGAENDPVPANNSATTAPLPLPPTTAQTTQRFCESSAPTLTNLQTTGRAVHWYATETGGQALDNTTALVTNTTYYATQTIGGYESQERLAVTVTVLPVASAGPDQTLASSTFTLAADPGVGTWEIVSVSSSTLTSGVVLADSSLYNTTVTVPNTATAVLRWTAAGSSCSDEVTLVNTTRNVADLTPIIYTRPSIQYGTTNVTVVVDVLELNAVAATGTITIRLTKDPMMSFTFDAAKISVDDRPVQNSAWTFDDRSDADCYVLTTTQGIAAGEVLSVGLTGIMSPGATSGALTLSLIIADGGGEGKINNNTDADKIEYFEK